MFTTKSLGAAICGARKGRVWRTWELQWEFAEPGKGEWEEPGSYNEDMWCLERRSVKSLGTTMRICIAQKGGAWRAWELQWGYAVPIKAELEEPASCNEDMQCQERRSVKSLGVAMRICHWPADRMQKTFMSLYELWWGFGMARKAHYEMPNGCEKDLRCLG